MSLRRCNGVTLRPPRLWHTIAAAAIRETFALAGKAIVYTSVALVAGYAILMLSNFKVIQYFAMLNLIAIVATTIGALVVLPLVTLFAQRRLGLRL